MGAPEGGRRRGVPRPGQSVRPRSAAVLATRATGHALPARVRVRRRDHVARYVVSPIAVHDIHSVERSRIWVYAMCAFEKARQFSTERAHAGCGY